MAGRSEKSETGKPPLSRQTGNWSGMHDAKPRPGEDDEQTGQREFTEDYPSYGSQYGRDRDFDPRKKDKLPPETPRTPGRGKTPV